MRTRTLLASAAGALAAGAIVPLPGGLNFTTAGREAFEVSA